MIGILCLVCLLAFPFLWLPGAAAQVKGPEAKPVYGGSYRRPLANNPSTLDPHLITDTYGRTVAQQLFDGLVQYDGSLTIIAAIAESWQGSRDGLSWTFSLRWGVKFHNGREVVADDVVYSFTRILDPRTKSGAAEFFMKIKGAKEFAEGQATTVRGLQALDRYTVVVPSVNPWIGIETLVTRERPGGSQESFGKAEAIRLDQAGDLFTINSARQEGMADKVGRIEPGMLADVIVVDPNPFEVPITEVHLTKVKMTFIGGEKVFDASSQPKSTTH